MPGAPTLSEIEATLDSILAPLREQLAVIDNELKELNTRKAELRQVRTKVSRLLGANSTPGPKPPKAKPSHGTGKPSSERLDSLEQYLRSAVNNGDDFNLSDLASRQDWLGIDRGYASMLMTALHERGSVRLVRTGHPEHGARTKIWRLTNA